MVKTDQPTVVPPSSGKRASALIGCVGLVAIGIAVCRPLLHADFSAGAVAQGLVGLADIVFYRITHERLPELLSAYHARHGRPP